MREVGVSYNKKKLHKVGCFRGLLKINKDIDESLRPLLQLCRETLLAERVNRLMTIQAVGLITTLTWALEVGDVSRFSAIKKAISYCGLCGAEKSSADNIKRRPLLPRETTEIIQHATCQVSL
jgi:transposase